MIRISDAANAATSDTSNSAFTINQPPPSITVTVPNGGEVWAISSTKTIQWTSTGIPGNVEIRLSRDGGRAFTEVLFADTPNDGNQTWVVTGFATRGAKIKITSKVNTSVSDTSDSVFTVQ
jgi:hypothetical protein